MALPSTVEELMESAELQNLHFCCPRCEGNIGRIVAVNFHESEKAA